MDEEYSKVVGCAPIGVHRRPFGGFSVVRCHSCHVRFFKGYVGLAGTHVS